MDVKGFDDNVCVPYVCVLLYYKYRSKKEKKLFFYVFLRKQLAQLLITQDSICFGPLILTTE
jgi:hypothetical protein